MRAMTLLGAVGLVVCAGCGDKAATDTGASCGSEVVLTDADNYTFTGTIELAEVVLKSQTDFELCWNNLTTTLRGNPMPDPATVDRVLLAKFLLTEEEVYAKLETGTLYQSDSQVQFFVDDAGAVCAFASDFEVLGNKLVPEVELFEDPNALWLATLMELDPRPDILMSKILRFEDAATDSYCEFTDGMSTIDFVADLHSGTNPCVDAGAAPYSLDLSAVTLDSTGAPYDVLLADELLIGRVDSSDIADVESVFVRLYEEAAELYTMDVYGLVIVDDLSAAVDAGGNAFPGFTTDGTWLIGTTCTLDTCTSPTPLFLTTVDVN